MTKHEDELPAAAVGGDETAFRDLVVPLQPQLHAHCNRMLGSVDDADDALQEVLLRAWRGLGRFEGRSSLRSWLYRIATNVCLNLIQKYLKRVLPLDHGPVAGPLASPANPREWAGSSGLLCLGRAARKLCRDRA